MPCLAVIQTSVLRNVLISTKLIYLLFDLSALVTLSFSHVVCAFRVQHCFKSDKTETNTTLMFFFSQFAKLKTN